MKISGFRLIMFSKLLPLRRGFPEIRKNGDPYLKGDTPMKTKEELNALKEEVETVSRKLHELTEDDLPI